MKTFFISLFSLVAIGGFMCWAHYNGDSIYTTGRWITWNIVIAVPLSLVFQMWANMIKH